jgi:hypothetical protein
LRRKVNKAAMKFPLIVLLLGLIQVASGLEQEREFSSGGKNVPLLELYTSEGCSSCPPAEEWFSTLTKSPLLWKELVPVAFHVDYWNYLGWPDPYSSSEASSRQHEYASEWKSRSVYTPEFVINGREWRIGERITSGDGTRILKVRLSKTGTIDASFTNSGKSEGPFLLNIAPMSCGIHQTVTRGENEGRTLRHDFVALATLQSPLKSGSDGTGTAQLMIPKDLLSKSEAIAAWITKEGSQRPIQAAGGWLN